MNLQIQQPQGTAYLVDDDAGVVAVLEDLLATVRVETRGFPSPYPFLADPLDAVPACVVLDVRLPGITGIEVLRILKEDRRLSLPVVMLTGHGDVTTAVRAMKLGAFDFVEKPVAPLDLVEVVQRALNHHANTAERAAMVRTVDERVALLSDREREILDFVVRGCSTKEIAQQLSISSHTVDNHRAKVMLKMQASSVADLVRMVCATIPVLPLRGDDDNDDKDG